VIIKNGFVLQKNICKKDIRVEGNIITEIGNNLKGSDIIDASHHLVMPGLVNTHTHVAMTLLRGYADDVSLQEWLKDYIWPQEMKLTPQDCYYGNLLGIVEMIKSGTTCFNDMYFHESKALEAVRESGMRAVLSPGLADFGIKKREGHLLRKGLEFFDLVKNESRIAGAFGPHSPYTCSPNFLLKLQEYAQKMGKLVHIHLHEDKEEIRKFEKSHKKTPIALLESIGFLDSNVCAAHGVHISPNELDILKKRKVKILHCPSSNLKLANGIAPVAEMVKNGICVSLGTDGAASNNTLDLFAEMRLMALLQKLKDPDSLRAGVAIEIATENGGIALNWKVGKVEKGFLADVIFVNLKESFMVPKHDIVSNVVYSMNSSAVDTVIIDGRIVMENREILTLNEGEVIEKAGDHAFDLINR
jgi:5-methylthioadenosine/S-adenosylhomocysteine deaminase